MAAAGSMLQKLLQPFARPARPTQVSLGESRGAEGKEPELSDEELKHAVTVIVVFCSASMSPFMHVVEAKGSSMDKFAAERIVEDIVFLGHTRVILRSDNEPALL